MANGFDHTPTPWHVAHEGAGTFTSGPGLEIRADCQENHNDGFCTVVIASMEYDGKIEDEERANARRIVAAVNATADIPIGVLERMAEAAQKHRDQQIAETEPIAHG